MGVHKTLAEARANFESAIPMIRPRYEAGVDKATWADKASSSQAEENYATAVQKAISNKTRAKMCREAGDAAWKTGAKEKGGPIIGTRLTAAMPKYEEKFGPIYAGVTADVDRMPPKTVDWRTNIEQRLVKTVESWKKHSGKG